MASLRCCKCHRTLLGRILKQETTMRSILLPFIALADPIHDGLVDTLISRGVLDSSHSEKVRSETEREEQARKVWKLMLKVSPKTFTRSVEPVLRKMYGFVFEKALPVPPSREMCLRCVMELMLPLDKVADKLVVIQSLRLSDTRDWPHVFSSMQRDSKNPAVLHIVQRYLQQFEIPVPDNLPQALAYGLPCFCDMQDDVETERSTLCTTCLRCSLCKEEEATHRSSTSPRNIENRSNKENQMPSQSPCENQEEEQTPEVSMRKRSCKEVRTRQLQMARNDRKTKSLDRSRHARSSRAGCTPFAVYEFSIDDLGLTVRQRCETDSECDVEMRPTSSRNIRSLRLKQIKEVLRADNTACTKRHPQRYTI